MEMKYEAFPILESIFNERRRCIWRISSMFSRRGSFLAQNHSPAPRRKLVKSSLKRWPLTSWLRGTAEFISVLGQETLPLTLCPTETIVGNLTLPSILRIDEINCFWGRPAPTPVQVCFIFASECYVHPHTAPDDACQSTLNGIIWIIQHIFSSATMHQSVSIGSLLPSSSLSQPAAGILMVSIPNPFRVPCDSVYMIEQTEMETVVRISQNRNFSHL